MAALDFPSSNSRGCIKSGYHYIAWLEYGGAGASTFVGDGGVGFAGAGMIARIAG